MYIELREYYFVDRSYIVAVESFTKSVITKGPSLGIWSLVTRGPTLLNTKSFFEKLYDARLDLVSYDAFYIADYCDKCYYVFVKACY